MRGIAVACPYEGASYVAVSFSVGLDEPIAAATAFGRKSRQSRFTAHASTIAHLAEHVVATLTCATEPDQETAIGILRATGISHNASTSAWETCFHAAGTTHDLELTWIPMLFAAIHAPNISLECVETERSAALDEMYAVRAACSVTDGKLDAHIASVEAAGSWQTRVDDDIAFLEGESARRIADTIGAFIAEFYCSARMHITVASEDADTLLRAARRSAAPTQVRSVLPRSVYPWTNWQPGSVSVIPGSAGDTTRVRFYASVNVSSDPMSVLASACAAWCVSETLFVQLRVRSNAVYSVHAALDLRAVTNEERDGEHDAAIVVATVCTHDKAPLVARAIRDALFSISPELVRDWARARALRIQLEPRDPVSIGERAREVSVAATNDPVARADRLALVESVTHADVAAAVSRTRYRVYASSSDAPTVGSLRRAIERALVSAHTTSTSKSRKAKKEKSRPKRPKNESR